MADKHLILSIDPGITTGIAWATVAEGEDLNLETGFEVKYEDRYSSFKGAMQLCSIYASQGLLQLILIESYRLYPHRAKQKIGSDFPEIRTIGILETYAHEFDLSKYLVWQPASAAKGLRIPDGWTGKLQGSEHARDAAAHIWYWWLTSRNKASQASSRRPRRGSHADPATWFVPPVDVDSLGQATLDHAIDEGFVDDTPV